MWLAETLGVPWLAWAFSEQSDPSMLLPAPAAGDPALGCHVAAGARNALQPNVWGAAVQQQLAATWGSVPRASSRQRM